MSSECLVILLNLVLIGAEHFARRDRAEPDPCLGGNRTLDEPDRAVAEADINAAGMAAAGTRVAIPFVAIAREGQLLDRLVVAQRAARGRARSETDAAVGWQVVDVVIPGVHGKSHEQTDVLHAVGGESRRVRAAARITNPDQPPDIVGRSLEHFRNELGIAEPVGDARNPDRLRARPRLVRTERRRQITRRILAVAPLAVIRVAKVGAIVALRRRPRVGRNRPSADGRERGQRKRLLVIARALKRKDLGCVNRAIDSEA